MGQIAFLIADTDTLQDGNYLRLANACLEEGHAASIALMESLGMAGSKVYALGRRLEGPAAVGEPMACNTRLDLAQFDVIWILSLGMRHSFLDKMQLLFTLSRRARIVNSIDAIMHFKSKYFTAGHADVYKHPATWASNRPQALFDVMQSEGGRWIVKPPASSFGRDVYLLTADDPNARVILESMCGPDEDNYCLLQRYVEEIRHGEKRVLLAAGKPVGQYLRTAVRDHRTNLEQGAKFEAVELSAEEYAYCERIGGLLKGYGAEFVGMDLAYPWVIEFNVVNPGGILTLAELGSTDVASQVIRQVLGE